MDLNQLFINIANQIRYKTSTNDLIQANSFPFMIRSIPQLRKCTNNDIAWIDKTYNFSDISSINPSIIGSYVFACFPNLTSISFSNCTLISDYAFYYCSNLASISFPNCTYIGSSAFQGCYSLISVNFPNCSSIGQYAFYRNSNLASISFPNCIYIGAYAFSGCYNLTTLDFSQCQYVYTEAFWSCSNIITANFPALKSTGTYAFEYCRSMTTFSCGSNLSYLGTNTFSHCEKLMSIYIPTSTVPTLANINAFVSTPISISTLTGSFGSIYVLSSMVNSFKTATNWATYSDRITAYTP